MCVYIFNPNLKTGGAGSGGGANLGAGDPVSSPVSSFNTLLSLLLLSFVLYFRTVYIVQPRNGFVPCLAFENTSMIIIIILYCVLEGNTVLWSI